MSNKHLERLETLENAYHNFPSFVETIQYCKTLVEKDCVTSSRPELPKAPESIVVKETFFGRKLIKKKEETTQEEKVLSLLDGAWNEFIKLERQHPDEQSDFGDGVHQCQYVIGMRVARKHRPDLFPIKK